MSRSSTEDYTTDAQGAYPPDQAPPRRPSRSEVPMARWGKDHWSAFAFVAHWCAEPGAGAAGFKIEARRKNMRCDPARRPDLAHIEWRADCPTILKGGELLPCHDDWDCLDDAQAAGLLLIEGTGAFPVIFMTDKGLRIAAELTAHKTRAGNFADFRVED